MINNTELPIGFTMELAQHPDVLNQFAKLTEEQQHAIIEGAKKMNSRQQMRNFVENLFRIEG